MKKLPLGKIAIILTAVFLVSGGAATVLTLKQVYPNGFSDGPANAEEYTFSRSVPIERGAQVDIDMTHADVTLTEYDGSEVEIDFEGWRASAENGILPEIIVTETDGGIKISEREDRPANFIIFDMFYFVSLEGRLTVRVPRGGLGNLTINTFSTDIDVTDCSAQSAEISTSSGDLRVSNLDAGETSLKTFSGGISLTDVSAENCTIDSSSGGVRVIGLKTGGFDCTTFSGAVTLENVSAEHSAEVDTSSGSVTGTALDAGSLTVTTFSGRIELPELRTQTLVTDTSSGAVTAELLTNADITCKSFSGRVDLTLPAGMGFTLDVDTFSGGTDIGFEARLSGGSDDRDVSATVGDGSRSVRIETSSGSVAVNPAGR